MTIRTMAAAARNAAVTPLATALKPQRLERARQYLEDVGALTVMAPGAADEEKPDYLDQAFLHRLIRRHRIATVLEFGIGFSTLCMAHALHLNRLDAEQRAPGALQRQRHRLVDRMKGRKRERSRAYPFPALHSVDASEAWIANTVAKVPEHLRDYIHTLYSQAACTTVDGELCHRFSELPNVRPELIYLDGPDPSAVQGDCNGLAFGVDGAKARDVMAADILLYESTLGRGTFIVVDGRRKNVLFLLRRLKRRWHFMPYSSDNRFVLRLSA